MPQTPGRLQYGPPGDPDPMDVLGPDHHGRKGGRISWPPFQGIIRCNTGHAPLGIIGGRWEGGSIGYLVVNIAPVGVFLRQKRPDPPLIVEHSRK